jgi:hypothetical protein
VAIASPIQNQKAKGQPANRRYQRYRDQHNRRFGATVENKTGDPVGTIDPVGGWSAPWMPHPKYLELARDEDGQLEVGRLYWNYGRLLKDIRDEQRDNRARLEFYAQAMYGESAGEKIEKPPAALLRLLKYVPQHPQVVLAAMKGDRWLLGMEKGECPEYLRPYFTKQQLVKEVGGDAELYAELGIDEEFVKSLEARFDAAKIKGKEAPDSLKDVASRAREDAEAESATEARQTASRLRGNR